MFISILQSANVACVTVTSRKKCVDLSGLTLGFTKASSASGRGCPILSAIHKIWLPHLPAVSEVLISSSCKLPVSLSNALECIKTSLQSAPKCKWLVHDLCQTRQKIDGYGDEDGDAELG